MDAFVQRVRDALDDAAAELPVVAVEFRPQPGDFPIATRIRLVGAFQDIRPAKNRIVAPLVDVADGFIELLGPAFLVAPNAKIKAGKENVDLAQLATLLAESEEGVLEGRFEVRPPAPDAPEGLAVVEKLKVELASEEVEVRGGAHREGRAESDFGLLGISPFDGETGVGFENDDGEIEATMRIEFNVQVRRIVEDEHFLFEIFPEPEDLGDLELSHDGRSIFLEVLLAPETVYQLVAVIPGVGPVFSIFTTGDEVPETSITGSVILPDDLELDAVSPDASFVIITEDDPADLLDEDDPEDIEPLLDAAVAVVPLGRTYEAFGLAEGTYYEGTYYLYAQIIVDVGRDVFFVSGIVDEDGDGESDPVEITAEEPNPTADIAIVLPEPLMVVSHSPEGRRGSRTR